MIKCLADAKVNLNVLDRREQTPLINAILQEDIKSALILIESEANLEIKTSFGDTVLMLAICNNLVEVCRALIAKLIQSNVNTQIYLDQKNNANQTALSLALTLGNIEIVKMLINANANVNQKFSLGETVLMSALSSPNVTIEMIKFLVDAKVNLDEKNDYGETALLRAVAHSNAEIINFLIQAHANVDAQDEVGQTALISAVQRDKVDIAMALIAAKANLELKDINGQTARMCAVENGLEKVVLAIDNRLQEIALENEAKNKALLFSNPLKITAAQPEEESVSIHRPRSDSK
jgi:ankyrin repeat protein